MRYVALLGSINVGGNRLKMADLKAALEDDGFDNVETVTASGNVLFDYTKASDEQLERRIADIVRRAFKIDTFAAVRTGPELKASIACNPFVKDGEARFVHTVFLDHALDRDAFLAFVHSYAGPERLSPGTREYFVDYTEGVGRSKLDPAMSKAKLIKGRATARNVRSLARIGEKMDAGSS